MLNSNLIGRSFDLHLGGFIPRLTFLDAASIRVQAIIGGTVVDEVVSVTMASIRPNVFLIGWTESSGTFVTQLQDHEAGLVHNHARLPNGHAIRVQGAIKEHTVPAEAP